MYSIQVIIAYCLEQLFKGIGIAAGKSVRIARRMAWIVIELILVIGFLYAIAFIAASVGMLVVEQPVEHRVDTIQTNQSKLQTIKQLNSKWKNNY